uniref:CUB domain-containing protein n=1 Tax=Magallana gigas TaxID=29159 RepID=A0A8W8JFP7_MAGGI
MFCWLLASVFLVTAKGQCLLNSNDSGVVVSRCNPSVYNDLVIHIDFSEFNSPCTCNVTPKFTGDLFVLSNNSTAEECNTQIKINDDFMFDCAAPAGSNHSLNVQSNQIVHVRAEYIKPSKKGMFHQCLQIRQDDIIAGFATGGVVLLGIIMCILALTKREKIERTKDKSTEEDNAPTNENADSSNALRENPLYISADEVEDIMCTEDKQQGEGYSTATDLESNRDHDDGPSINQPVDSVPVFPVPNNSNISHSRRDVYAQVYKQNKSSATVHDILQTQNQNSLFYIGVE